MKGTQPSIEAKSQYTNKVVALLSNSRTSISLAIQTVPKAVAELLPFNFDFKAEGCNLYQYLLKYPQNQRNARTTNKASNQIKTISLFTCKSNSIAISALPLKLSGQNPLTIRVCMSHVF